MSDLNTLYQTQDADLAMLVSEIAALAKQNAPPTWPQLARLKSLASSYSIGRQRLETAMKDIIGAASNLEPRPIDLAQYITHAALEASHGVRA